MKKGDILYYVRILPNSCNICDLKVRAVEDDYFVGVDKRDKHAYLLPYSYLNIKVFKNFGDAFELAKRIEVIEDV